MTIRLNEFWVHRLSQLPESGMGYQRVDVTLKNGSVLKNLLVLNAEDCETDEAFEVSDIADIRVHRNK